MPTDAALLTQLQTLWQAVPPPIVPPAVSTDPPPEPPVSEQGEAGDQDPAEPATGIANDVTTVTAVLRCRTHIDPSLWLDAAVAGRIRTTCRLCGTFVGYRPANLQ